jgi:hypothetical protein
MRARGLWATAAVASAIITVAGAAGAQQPEGGAEGGINIPPADQPVIERIPTPRISIEGGAGVLGYTGGAASLGPMWNVRVTGHLSPRFAVEGNYVGAANEATWVDETLVMTSIDVGVRYNILDPEDAPAQPYVVAGVGYAGWSGDNGDPFALTIPLTIGAERMLTRTIKVGARVNFKPAFMDEFGEADDAPGGDTWSLGAHLGGAF